jgi:3-hydroxyacyl-CoA dehydrogenase
MEVYSVAVIGAGVMGSGIAQTLAVAGCQVRCHDIDEAQLERAAALVEGGRYGLVRAVERGKLAGEDAEVARHRLSFTHVLDEAVTDVDLVVEAVPEVLALKMEVFGRLDRSAPTKAILASNSSGFPVAALAGATRRPDRVIGWHWASPPPIMGLAEIVVTDSTSAETRDAVVALATAAGKRPVVVRDNPRAWGYVGNRIYTAALREARAVVDEGVVDEDGVDTILTSGWNWPVGPFAMIRGATEGWGDGHQSSVGDRP